MTMATILPTISAGSVTAASPHPPTYAGSSSSGSPLRTTGITSHTLDGWSDPKAKEFYERGKAAEHRMFYSQSECGDLCGHEPECMCTICICGNHRCPEPLRHVPYGDLRSEYSKRFPGWDTYPTRQKGKVSGAFRPTPVPGMYDRKTAAPAEAAPRARPLPDQRRPQLPFEGQTEYKDTYIPKQPDERWQQLKDIVVDPIPFEATTEHRTMFDGTPAEPAKPVKHGETPFERGPFQGVSEYDHRYDGQPGQLRRPAQQQPRKWTKGPPRSLKSQYQDEYTGNGGLLCPARSVSAVVLPIGVRWLLSLHLAVVDRHIHVPLSVSLFVCWSLPPSPPVATSTPLPLVLSSPPSLPCFLCRLFLCRLFLCPFFLFHHNPLPLSHQSPAQEEARQGCAYALPLHRPIQQVGRSFVCTLTSIHRVYVCACMSIMYVLLLIP